jgi:putative oxidoreductase
MTVTATEPQPYIPALRRFYVSLAPYAYPFIRFCVGAIIVRHGFPKVFAGGAAGLSGFLAGKLHMEPALVWAWIIAFAECGGGALLAIGLFTRLVSAALVIEFAMIVFVVKWANGMIAFAPTAIQPGFPGLSAGGFEFEMLLGLCCLAFLFGGGGKASVDQMIGKEF